MTQLLVNLQWYKIAKLAGAPFSFGSMLYVNCQGSVIDSITPGVKFGGEVTRAVQISRIGHCSGEQAAAIVALQKLFSLSAMFLLLLFAVGYLVDDVPWLSRHTQFIIYGVLLIFLLLFFTVFFAPHRIEKHIQAKGNPRYSWMRKVRGFFLALLNQIKIVRGNKSAWAMLSFLSLLIWLLYPVKMYILAVQFYPGANIAHVTAITFAAYMVALLPIFPGGLGGFEGTMTGLFVAMGIVISDAAVMTVFFRFATFWLVMLVSLVYIAFYKARVKTQNGIAEVRNDN